MGQIEDQLIPKWMFHVVQITFWLHVWYFYGAFKVATGQDVPQKFNVCVSQKISSHMGVNEYIILICGWAVPLRTINTFEIVNVQYQFQYMCHICKYTSVCLSDKLLFSSFVLLYQLVCLFDVKRPLCCSVQVLVKYLYVSMLLRQLVTDIFLSDAWSQHEFHADWSVLLSLQLRWWWSMTMKPSTKMSWPSGLETWSEMCEESMRMDGWKETSMGNEAFSRTTL